MNLGAFSVSLAVTDVERSAQFYEKLGFRVIDGGHTSTEFPDNEQHRWRILQNGGARIGLFQGMFENNLLSFAPQDLERVRSELKKNGALEDTAAEDGAIIIKDPDGNAILFDAH